MHRYSSIALAVTALVTAAGPAAADMIFFNATSAGNSESFRQQWLDAIGIAAPQHLVDFESGFAGGENIHAMSDLFPLDLVIRDTAASEAIVFGGSIGGSNPVGSLAVTQNEDPYLELDFSAAPVDYVAFRDIDQSGTNILVTYVGGGTGNFSIETTSFGGDSAEFVGFYRNDMPRIQRIQLDASGDGLWGVDNIEYGVLDVECPADLDGSNDVGPGDLAILLAAWGDCPPGGPCPADLDGDLSVGPGDLAVLLAAWGPCR